MKYQIRQLSLYAENILKNLTSGTIHSVYRRTINLTAESYKTCSQNLPLHAMAKPILALQADGSPLSPISLISCLSAEDMEALSVKAGDPVQFTEDGFTFPCPPCAHRPVYHFTCRGAKRFSLTLQEPHTPGLLPKLNTRIQTALSRTDTGGFALLFQETEENTDDLSLILLAARKHIQHGSELCLRGDYREAALTLTHLLGLGTGLTPSGDDFLCGVLAGLSLAGKSRHPFTGYLKSEIAGRLSDTIDISAAFLSCALEDQFSLQVKSLLSLPSSEALLSSFQEIGHSSGTDTLCGILWSLQARLV